jgi:hypothetical protein
MKTILAQDSLRLIVLDDKVKHRGLFSYLLTRALAVFLLLSLTAYGLLHLIL